MDTKLKFEGLTDDITFKYIFSKDKILIDFLNSFFAYMNIKRRVIKVCSTPQKFIQASKRKYKSFFGDNCLNFG